MSFDEQLKAAVRASAAPVPEDFLWNTEQMINRLPRKERIIVRNKLSFGLILAIILCTLTLTAVAAVLLTSQELVETEVLPMAIDNDSGAMPSFTEEEIQFIAALAEKNGVSLSDTTLQDMQDGLMRLSYDAAEEMAPNPFGPEPMTWPLAEQYWFHEAMVQLGREKTNDHLIPSEGDLTVDEAIARALELATRQPDEYNRKEYLKDPANYTVTCSYQKALDVRGNPLEKAWLIGFMEKNGPSWTQVLMDGTGGRIAVFWQDTTERADVNTAFSNEELQHIVALAEENGITLSDNILRALENGEGYWEEEVIMSLAKAQFGPQPGQWTIEQQYWFGEMDVAIGFVDVNHNCLPGEGDLTYEEAYARAVQLLQAEGWVDDPAWLEDRTQFALTRTFNMWEEYGDEPMWYFYFDPRQIDLPLFTVLMTRSGEVESVGRRPGLSEQLENGMPANSVRDMFNHVYGNDWSPEVYVAYVEALRKSDLSRASKAVQAYLATDYILPPEGALTSEEAIAIAAEHIGSESILSASTVCFQLDGRAVWKAILDYDGLRPSDMVEMDALTGEILDAYPAKSPSTIVQYNVPRRVYESPALGTPNPEGNG